MLTLIQEINIKTYFAITAHLKPLIEAGVKTTNTGVLQVLCICISGDVYNLLICISVEQVFPSLLHTTGCRSFSGYNMVLDRI